MGLFFLTVQMTVLECPDSLAALLTESDSLPGCDHKRCMGMMVCAHSPSLTNGCLDRWTDLSDCSRWRSVGHYSLLPFLCFLKRRRWRGRSSNASVSLSPEGVRGLMEKGHINKGTDGSLWSRASHVTPQCQSEHSDPPVWELSRRERQRTLHYHIHLGREDTPVADDVAHQLENQLKLFGSHWRHWHIRKDLLHRYIEHVMVISCYGSFIKVFTN